MTLTLIVDNDLGDRLEEAFAEFMPGRIRRLPAFAIPEPGLGQSGRWLLCVGPALGSRIKLYGWRDALIFAVTRAEFEREILALGPRDTILFHDVPQARLRSTAQLAIAGLTVFPDNLVPEGAIASTVVAQFETLGEEDRLVMAELAVGSTNQAIAEQLGWSIDRVRQSVERIFRRLGCSNRTAVAVLAYSRFSPFLELPRQRLAPVLGRRARAGIPPLLPLDANG